MSVINLNWLVPLMLGAPDKLMTPNQLKNCFSFLCSLQQNNKSSNFQESSKITEKKAIESYLAGLWEGDGHIILPKFLILDKKQDTHCKKLTTTKPSFSITFVDKDLPLVIKLVDKYGGWIRFKRKEKAVVWTITKHSELLNIVKLINGFLRTPKIYQFNLLLKYLNEKYPTENLKYYTPDLSPLLENYWLAGFIDAKYINAGFKIRYSTSSENRKQRIEIRFSLEQKQFHSKTQEPFGEIMQLIANLFLVKLNISKHNNKEYWIIEVTSINKLKILVDYLTKYPLLTSKFNDYKDWYKAYELVQFKLHLTDDGKKTILNLKSNMNRKRTIFDWSHLNCLY
jgi:hypothetical protein